LNHSSNFNKYKDVFPKQTETTLPILS
jgi:hypothetical protein